MIGKLRVFTECCSYWDLLVVHPIAMTDLDGK